AENILQQQREKIANIQTNFLDAMELTARNDKQKVIQVKELFDKIDEIYRQLSYLHYVPVKEDLRYLQDSIFNITCFESARNVVEVYTNLTQSGIETLQNLDLLSYDRSLYINNYLMFLSQMRIETMNFETILSMQFGSSSFEPQSLGREAR